MKKLENKFETKKVYTGQLLYIVRNNGNSEDRHNKSILGVFTTPQEAKEAVEVAKEIQTRANGEACMEVKVVIPGLSMYHGCSAFSLQQLLDDPFAFEQKVREWTMWERFISHHNNNYGLK
jgi:hypothetical protein